MDREHGNRLISSLCYQDAQAAISWLECAFGFTAHLVVPGENDTVLHSQLIAPDGRSMIMLFTQRDDDYGKLQNTPKALGGRNQALYMVVDDVDAHHARAVEAGATIHMPPTKQDYGGSSYTCEDPEGHIWSFGSYDPWAEVDGPQG